MLEKLRNKNDSAIISYIALRRFIGILGMLLPVICILGGIIFSEISIYPSISAYYYTNMRDFFVGLLIGISFFLITYKGYELIDNVITTFIGITGFGIAAFPCYYTDSTLPVGIFQLNPDTSNIMHIICASIFFILLAVNSIFLFTLSKDKKIKKGSKKAKRNIIYISCGIIILISVITLFIINFTVDYDIIIDYNIVLIFEAVMLFVFGISWLVKGDTLFKDETKKQKSI